MTNDDNGHFQVFIHYDQNDGLYLPIKATIVSAMEKLVAIYLPAYFDLVVNGNKVERSAVN